MSGAVVLGVGIISFFFLLFGSIIDRNEHGMMRNFLFILGFMMLIMIAPSLILEQNVCSVVVGNESTSYVYGDNLTSNWAVNSGGAPVSAIVYLVSTNSTYEYTTFCYEQKNGGDALHKAMMIIYIIFIIYISLNYLKEFYLMIKKALRKI
jgi:hypothetical protein